MLIDIWQLREVKRALTTFCDHNELELGDEAALKAAEQLLQVVQQRSFTSEQLLRRLRTQNTNLYEGAAPEKPSEIRNNAAQSPLR